LLGVVQNTHEMMFSFMHTGLNKPEPNVPIDGCSSNKAVFRGRHYGMVDIYSHLVDEMLRVAMRHMVGIRWKRVLVRGTREKLNGG